MVTAHHATSLHPIRPNRGPKIISGSVGAPRVKRLAVWTFIDLGWIGDHPTSLFKIDPEILPLIDQDRLKTPFVNTWKPINKIPYFRAFISRSQKPRLVHPEEFKTDYRKTVKHEFSKAE
jgi:hypothetical protein